MKKISLFQILIFFLSLVSCQNSANKYQVEYVNRNTVFSSDKTPNPLLLIVEITEDGKIRLNKIETGTIEDHDILAEKLKAIFDDRRRQGNFQREIVIDPKGKIKQMDMEKLIKSLSEAKAAPIVVIKNG